MGSYKIPTKDLKAMISKGYKYFIKDDSGDIVKAYKLGRYVVGYLEKNPGYKAIKAKEVLVEIERREKEKTAQKEKSKKANMVCRQKRDERGRFIKEENFTTKVELKNKSTGKVLVSMPIQKLDTPNKNGSIIESEAAKEAIDTYMDNLKKSNDEYKEQLRETLGGSKHKVSGFFKKLFGKKK